jgi:SAM-dependent methyltransferase
MEWLSFGPWLWRCRSAFLDRLGNRRAALVMGDGDGRFTAALLRTNLQIEVDAVDASGAMLGALRQRTGVHANRLRTEIADARAWRAVAERRYDHVATHFFLDCLTTEEVRCLARAIGPALMPGSIWVLSEFDIPANMYGRMIARPLVWFLYRAFALMTGLTARRLPDYRGALQEAGFSRVESRCFLGGLLVSELWGSISDDRDNC